MLLDTAMILRVVYTFFVGIFLAVFVGVGIAAFYPSPKYPEMPAMLKYCSVDLKDAEGCADYKRQSEEFDKVEREYRTTEQNYSRNVSTIAVVAAVIMVITSLTLFRTILLIADGILLGGVLTLLYGTIRGFGAENMKFLFLIVTVGLVVSLLLGYLKLIKPTIGESKKVK